MKILIPSLLLLHAAHPMNRNAEFLSHVVLTACCTAKRSEVLSVDGFSQHVAIFVDSQIPDLSGKRKNCDCAALALAVAAIAKVADNAKKACRRDMEFI